MTNGIKRWISGSIALAAMMLVVGCQGAPAESQSGKTDGAPAERAKAQQDQFDRLKPKPLEPTPGGTTGN